MTNTLSLRPGDRIPDFVLPGLDGKLRKFVWSFTGDPVALLAVMDLSTVDAAQFASLRDACAAASTKLVVVAGNTVAASAPAWKKLGASPEVPLLLCDEKGQFLPAFLSQAGAVSFGQGMGMRQRVIALDPNQRVATTFDTRALLAAAEAMSGVAQSVRADGGADLCLNTAMAPVLVLPRVFEPDFCTQPSACGQGRPQGFGRLQPLRQRRHGRPEAHRGLYDRRADDAEGGVRSPRLSHRARTHQGLRLRSRIHLRFPRRTVLQRRGAALLRRASRQRCADDGRSRLRRIAEPQRRFRGRRVGLFRSTPPCASALPRARQPSSPAPCCTRSAP